jgi:hypothetical protein
VLPRVLPVLKKLLVAKITLPEGQTRMHTYITVLQFFINHKSSASVDLEVRLLVSTPH